MFGLIFVGLFVIAGFIVGFLIVRYGCYPPMDVGDIGLGICMGLLLSFAGFLIGILVLFAGSCIPDVCAETEWVIEEQYDIVVKEDNPAVSIENKSNTDNSYIAYKFFIDTHEFGKEEKMVNYDITNIREPDKDEKPTYIKYRKQYTSYFLRNTFLISDDEKYILVIDDDLIDNNFE
jgi:hypothetical protein